MTPDSGKSSPLYLFDNQELFLHQVSHSSNILLFLDYDGTLVGFKKDPQNVTLSKNVRDILRTFRDDDTFELIIITGRALSEIRDQVDLTHINFAAVHGLHIQFKDGTTKIIEKAATIKPQLDKIKKEARQIFHHEPGVHIEDKTYTLAFHYRSLPNKKIPQLKEQFIDIIKKYNKDNIHILEGDKVVEARPMNWNKGDAVKIFLKKEKHDTAVLPMYVGDDTTDEDAFKYLQRKGLTIYVKNNSELKTHASYWVKNPNEVKRLLSMLIEKIM